MLNKLKAIVVNWLLSDERERLERLRAFYEEQEKRRSSLSIVQLVREQLKGFDPSMLDNYDEIEETYPEDGEGLDAFLNQVGELKKNTALPVIEQFIIRNQILFSAKEAPSLEAINFGRASVNGVSLIREEIDRLEKIREVRSKPPEEFDEHEVM